MTYDRYASRSAACQTEHLQTEREGCIKQISQHHEVQLLYKLPLVESVMLCNSQFQNLRYKDTIKMLNVMKMLLILQLLGYIENQY